MRYKRGSVHGYGATERFEGEDGNVGRCLTMKALLTVCKSLNLSLNVMENQSQCQKKNEK